MQVVGVVAKMVTFGHSMGRDSSVDVTIRYGLDGTEIESRWEGEIFLIGPDWPCLPRGKATGAWC